MHAASRFLLLGVTSLLFAGCVESSSGIVEPIGGMLVRPTPLYFGLHVTTDPADNPISPPERFSGYHVATDFEVSAEELDADVPVYAACSGKVLSSGFTEGYGGLLVQQCRIAGQDYTMIYGHLLIEGLPPKGAVLKAGQKISVLAPARSRDSDGNRKHLHFGIHKGKGVDVRGYVQSQSEVDEFVDPLTLLPHTGSGDLLIPKIMPYWQDTTGTGGVLAL